MNKELWIQILSNEKKIVKLMQENSLLQIGLNIARQKFKEIQNYQATLIKIKKRMSSTLVAGPNLKIYQKYHVNKSEIEGSRYIVM